MKIAYIGEHHPTDGTYYRQRITVTQKEFNYINNKLGIWHDHTHIDVKSRGIMTDEQATILWYGKKLTETDHANNKYYLKLTQLYFIQRLYPKEKRILNENTILCVNDTKMTYQQRKEKARQEAIDWQNDFGNHNYYWSEIADFGYHFYKLGKRYGLLREFRENGIC